MQDARPVNAAAIVASLVGIYVLSQFFRNALAVIGPDISREFDLDAAKLGFLSSIFFFNSVTMMHPFSFSGNLRAHLSSRASYILQWNEISGY